MLYKEGMEGILIELMSSDRVGGAFLAMGERGGWGCRLREKRPGKGPPW